MSKHQTTDFDLARDELFSHVQRCGVRRATPEQQEEWFTDTLDYIGERYTGLSQQQLRELHDIGMRFCQPAIPHGKDHTALTDSSSDEREMAGAA